MKIVRIIARLNVGGPARHVVWLTQALADDEFQSVLLAGKVPPGEEDMAYFADEHGVEPLFIDEMSRELSLKDAVSLWKVYRHLLRERPDIIHTHTAKAGTVGRVAGLIYRWFTFGSLIGRPRRVRFVHTYHGHVFHSYYGTLKTSLFLFIERVLARFFTDRIVVISRRQFEEICDKFKVGRAERFSVIPLGIDLGPFAPACQRREVFRAEIGADENKIVVGLVGRLTAVKNIGLFLEAAQLCSRGEANLNLRFVIVGDGDQRKLLETRAEELGVSDTVEFLGSRRDTDVFYAGLDIIALTSLNEGTPLSLIEAMAGGKAVVSTCVGGVPDLLGEVVECCDGFSICSRGVMVDSSEPAAFCNGLARLALDPELRRRLGDAGREFVAAEYSRERLIADIKDLYRDLARIS